jgi:hypothetical protein
LLLCVDLTHMGVPTIAAKAASSTGTILAARALLRSVVRRVPAPAGTCCDRKAAHGTTRAVAASGAELDRDRGFVIGIVIRSMRRTRTQQEDSFMEPRKTGGVMMGTVLLALGVVAFFAGAPVAIWHWGWRPTHVWALNITAGLAVLFAIGRVTGKHLLTDERRRWSLSRLQLLAWTALLLPSIWTMVTLKLLADVDDPLALGMDENLWALLGISAASFVGSPLILERKRATPGALDVRDGGSGDAGAGELRDLFRGEDTANADVVDVGRVQMCLFTALAILVYFAACWHAFASQAAGALVFPAMSQGLVALLGISHATYLAGKVPNRVATTARG